MNGDRKMEVRNNRAGRDINITEQVIVQAAPADEATRHRQIEGLLRGPVEACGLTATERRCAAHYEAGEFLDAAAGYEQVAEAVRENGYLFAAAGLEALRADALAAAGLGAEAAKAYGRLARDWIVRDSDAARRWADRARDVNDEVDPVIAGLQVLARFPAYPEGATEVLREARDSAEPNEHLWWSAHLVTALHLTGQADAARTEALEVVNVAPLTGGDRLDIELDLLDLLEPEQQDERWRLLESSLHRGLFLPEEIARVQQRRGVALAMRGESELATAAFLQAVHCWDRVPEAEEHAAQAYASSLVARAQGGDSSFVADHDRLRVVEGRANRDSGPAATEAAFRRGYRALAQIPLKPVHLNEARNAFVRAHSLADHHGALSDLLEAESAMGDTSRAADLPLDAVACYVVAGNVTKSADAAKGLPLDALHANLRPGAPEWQRYPAWAALAAGSDEASDETARRLASEALACLQAEGPWGFPTNSSFYALQVLGKVAPVLSVEQLYEALPHLRAAAKQGVLMPSVAARPLIAVTVSGRSDELSALLELALSDPAYDGVTTSGLTARLAARPELLGRLEAAASEGNRDALRLLAFSVDDLGEDLKTQARASVQTAIAGFPVQEEDGFLRVGMGVSLAPHGVYARHLKEPEVRRFVEAMLRRLRDTRVMLMDRRGAVEALYNATAVLPEDQVEEIADLLEGLASTADVVSDYERVGVEDPFAQMRIDTAPPDALRSSAIEAVCRMAAEHSAVARRVAPVLSAAFASGSEPVTVAALESLGRWPRFIPPPLNLASFVDGGHGRIRAAALQPLFRQSPAALLSRADRLAADPDREVRRRLLDLASDEQTVREAVGGTLMVDPDCFIRASARDGLRGARSGSGTMNT